MSDRRIKTARFAHAVGVAIIGNSVHLFDRREFDDMALAIYFEIQNPGSL